MIDKICYGLNNSDVTEIAAHLLRTDTAFKPALRSRVDIQAYAQKLYAYSVRFEARLGNELIGLVAVYCNQPELKKAFVTSVSVQPEYQGLGIGVQLMQQCVEHVRHLGYSQIYLEVNHYSFKVVTFYQKLGFNKLDSSDSTMTMVMILERYAI
jgi:ribosomal protein S18 acetylase RimI-like enzyme